MWASSKMNEHEIARTLQQLSDRYPEPLRQAQVRDIPRVAFHIRLVLRERASTPVSDMEIADLGGGIGLFSVGCAALGFKRVVLIDDFDDGVNHVYGESILELHRSLGVTVISRDVVSDGIEDIRGSFDAVTTFDSMEHWHHSPKRLFHAVIDKLRQDGLFMVGVPNAVNLRKRITVPFGYGKWTTMQDWYEAPRFRSHVREPDVDDLKYIARDLQLMNWRILGKNWIGHSSSRIGIQAITKIADPILQWIPQLCSDIYLIGKKQ